MCLQYRRHVEGESSGQYSFAAAAAWYNALTQHCNSKNQSPINQPPRICRASEPGPAARSAAGELTDDVILPDEDELLLTQLDVSVHEPKLAVQHLHTHQHTQQQQQH